MVRHILKEEFEHVPPCSKLPDVMLHLARVLLFFLNEEHSKNFAKHVVSQKEKIYFQFM